ncbi:discoidin domain-containing protein [Methylosinus sp. KRF6]|uniref:discoidin domain-containing protein n=1 Tax=Methylosinus sp. KRF6 TaxID=2846853 RepID=UPI001C0AD0E3|nr:discoidin domain-containing protein [Methylosinus sp. KRF6]MBU3890831.1 discoidin domain-containing protein [Methylosinus sp. KRF6]
MNVPPKALWKATASSGDPRHAIDDRYSTAWSAESAERSWLAIDLGEAALLGGLEIYWGRRASSAYCFEGSQDGLRWMRLCGSRHGEGGQEIFAFPPTPARFLRWSAENPEGGPGPDIVEINIYGPADAATTLEAGRITALGHAPVSLRRGESITVDFRFARSVVGALVEWGDSYGLDFSAYLSDDGENFRELGRITAGGGGNGSFWWPCASSRFLRLTLHEASAPEGAVVDELKLRILDSDRMPIGQLERAARAGRGELYPQALLGRQVYWTVLGEFDREGEALFDEYGGLEPRRGSPQITPLLRAGERLHGASASACIRHSLVGGSLPIPSVTWSVDGLEICATALAHAGQALVQYRIVNTSRAPRKGALVLAVRPAQINPYWQHGGHAPIDAIAVIGREARIDDRIYAAFSREPDAVTVADFDDGDVVRLIEGGASGTDRSLCSDSGLLSAAVEFAFSLPPAARDVIVVAAPLRDGVTPDADVTFFAVRKIVARRWRKKIGPRRITVGDPRVTETVEAQISLILVNATRPAFKPGPRNYDRIWIRDGSAQALALLWAGLAEEAEDFVLWYSQRLYPNGMVPPILDENGAINRGYGSDIEYDAQGEFVCVAAEAYRITRSRAFLTAVLEPVVRATRFIEELCARTNAQHGPTSRFHGLLPPSLSHEGYSEPSYSYWDDFFALSAFRGCAFLADAAGERETAAWARAKAKGFAEDLTRSIRMTSELMGEGMIAGSADREDVDPTSTSIAFEPCRVEDVLPPELLAATYDLCAAQIKSLGAPDFGGSFTPYVIRNLNAFVSLGRLEDAFGLLELLLSCRRPENWRHWAEVVWSPPRAPQYIGDMPHTWIGAEFVTAIRSMLLRENGDALELFRGAPDHWWDGEGITLRNLPTAFGVVDLLACRTKSRATIELASAGPPPERVTIRFPGAKRACADGQSCVIDGDVISSANFSRMVIDF